MTNHEKHLEIPHINQKENLVNYLVKKMQESEDRLNCLATKPRNMKMSCLILNFKL